MSMKMESSNKFVLVSLFCLGLILGVAESFDYHEKELESEEGLQGLYQRWKDHHNVKENRPERFNVFKYNVQYIHEKNKMNRPYKLGVNKFATMTQHEFLSTYGSSKFNHYAPLNGIKGQSLKAAPGGGGGGGEPEWSLANKTDIPPKLDWRCLNAVGPIKNQGQCGSCWAFGAVAGIEGINAIRTGKFVSLSEQEIIDCDTQGGCNGGITHNVFDFVRDHGGLCSDEFYPYVGNPGPCDQSKFGHHAATLGGHDPKMPRNDECALLKAAANQPVPTSIEASGDFMFYKEGLYTGPCGTDINHAVVIVGYDETPEGQKYWIVRNSWGEGWGEKGYVRMLRETGIPEGLCGINIQPALPIKDPAIPNNEL